MDVHRTVGRVTPEEQEEHVRALVAAAPPLSAGQRTRLRALLAREAEEAEAVADAEEAEWWTTSDVAAHLGVQVATVVNYRKRSQMPAPDKTVGRTHMWRPSRITEWQASRPRPGVGGRPAMTSGGVVLTPEMIEALAAEAEAGYDVDLLQARPHRRTLGGVGDETEQPEGQWPPTWFGSVRAGREDTSERVDEILRSESAVDGPTGDAG